jgi:hypothetical protein
MKKLSRFAKKRAVDQELAELMKTTNQNSFRIEEKTFPATRFLGKNYLLESS